MFRQCPVVFLLIVWLSVAGPTRLSITTAAPLGDSAATPAPRPTRSTNPATQPAPARSWSAEEAAARNAIISSKQWGDAMRAFNEWQSVQQAYDPQQSRELRIRLIDKINGMNAEELAEFLPVLEQKLNILLSAETRQARTWVRQNLDLASDQYADELRKKIPDVARMTPEQMRGALAAFDNKVSQRQNVQNKFNEGRKQQVKNVESELQRQRQAQDAAISRAYQSSQSSGGGGGLYSPGMPYNPPSFRPGFAWGW